MPRIMSSQKDAHWLLLHSLTKHFSMSLSSKTVFVASYDGISENTLEISLRHSGFFMFRSDLTGSRLVVCRWDQTNNGVLSRPSLVMLLLLSSLLSLLNMVRLMFFKSAPDHTATINQARHIAIFIPIT